MNYPRSIGQEKDIKGAIDSVIKEKSIKINDPGVMLFMGQEIPKGLKGIDLAIWKSEVKEKSAQKQ